MRGWPPVLMRWTMNADKTPQLPKETQWNPCGNTSGVLYRTRKKKTLKSMWIRLLIQFPPNGQRNLEHNHQTCWHQNKNSWPQFPQWSHSNQESMRAKANRKISGERCPEQTLPRESKLPLQKIIRKGSYFSKGCWEIWIGTCRLGIQAWSLTLYKSQPKTQMQDLGWWKLSRNTLRYYPR